MGSNASKSSERDRGGKNSKSDKSRVNQQKIEDLVDLGAVFPNGLYTATTEQDYDPRIVRSLIIARKIAPFYKGLAEAPETITVPLSTTLSPPAPSSLPQSSSSLSIISVESSSSPTSSSTLSPKNTNNSSNIVGRPRSASTTSRIKDSSYDPYVERRKAYVEKMKQREKMLYNDAVECPICFLYYPANINYSRCCDQPICTECFVQIHRPTETPSCPATCPFCMEENYGVLYETPLWSEKFQARSRSGSHSTMTGTRHTTSGVSSETDGPRRESVSHKNPDVVLIDHIRPNWNTSTQPAPNPVRAVSRRNSASAGTRRNGSNLLRAAGVGSLLTRPGRSASSAAATEYNQFLSNIRDVNMDLEDWMVMEAIRLSLAEQEENERKEALKKVEEEEKKKAAAAAQQGGEEQGESSTTARVLPQEPATSTSPTPLHLFDQNESSTSLTSYGSSNTQSSS